MRDVPLFLLLVAAGMAGNYCNLPIFFNIDFLFGSVFAMLALQYLGLVPGVAAAALIAGTTYFLWQHPYAIIIMTAEVAVVGYFHRRRLMGLVLADALYWLILGMPLVYLFYHGVMGASQGNVSITMIKQAVNGIANALLARLIFTAVALVLRNAEITYRDLIYNLFALFALGPALILVIISSRSDFANTDRNIRAELALTSARLNHQLAAWVEARANTVAALASLAGTLSAAQMQARLEQARTIDGNFLRIGMRDAASGIIAYAPLVDELGRANVGKKFAERPYIRRLRELLRPMLAEVVMARIGSPTPIAIVLAPVLKRGGYDGYVNGVLKLDRVRADLARGTADHAALYTLVDKSGNIIMSNREGQRMMAPLTRGPGRLVRLGDGVSQWLPELPSNVTISERWRSSFYVTDAPVGKLSEWRLILEQPVAPYQRALNERYAHALYLLFAVLLVALALAELISRRAIATVESLAALTSELPRKLAIPGTTISWPETSVKEANELIGNFEAMSDSLREQFDRVRQSNELLEQRVAERTADLLQSEEEHRSLIENSHDIIYKIAPDGVFAYVSPAWNRLLGQPLDQVLGKPLLSFVHPEDREPLSAEIRKIFGGGPRQSGMEFRVRSSAGLWRWFSSNAAPLKDKRGGIVAIEGSAMDVTERKQIEDQIRHMAFYDALTLLPNRRLLNDRLRQAMVTSKRNACYGALMFLDLDNFKPLNDTHGHDVGDLLLVEVAARLRDCVREMDTVARLGGDEFVVILANLDADKAKSLSQAGIVAEKIRSALAQPYLLTVRQAGSVGATVEHRCTVSIGAVLFMGGEVRDDQILKRADTAMYQAKEAGRNSIRFHRDELDPGNPPRV